MSRNDWEAGTIKIPAAAWPKLKAAVRAAQDDLQAKRLATAAALCAKLKEEAKGKRDFAWRAAAERLYPAVARQTRLGNADEEMDGVIAAILPHKRPATGSKGAPVTPAAKTFPKTTGATKAIRFGEASVSFDEKARTVGYSSGHNNKAVETARSHPIAIALFAALSQVPWTRGSGGEIVGNDEYNRDSRQDGGGANYVTRRYPPPKEAPSRALAGSGFHRGFRSGFPSRW